MMIDHNFVAFLLCFGVLSILVGAAEYELPTITIFSAAPSIDTDKKAAILSWLRLPQVTKIVLLGNIDTLSKEVLRIKSEAGSFIDIEVDDRVDTNFLGRPLFNSLIYRTLAAKTDIALYVNADVHLLPDVIIGLNTVREEYRNFVALAARWDIEDPDHRLSSSAESADVIHNWVTSQGSLQAVGGVDMWAYNVDNPLLNIPIPPFNIARGKYDNWLTHEFSVSSNRTCVDMTEAVTLIQRVKKKRTESGLTRRLNEKAISFTRRKSVKQIRKIKKKERKMVRRSIISKRKPSTVGFDNYWTTVNERNSHESFINGYLAYSRGSFKGMLGTAAHVSKKMTYCLGVNGKFDKLCIIERVNPGACICEHSNFVTSTTNEPHLSEDKKKVICGIASSESIDNYNLNATLSDSYESSVGIPYTLASLVGTLAIENTIILTAATFAYKEVIMSWVCNLRKLKITNFVVGALDPEMYKFLYVQGVPVYFEDIFKTMRSAKERVHAGSVQSAGCDGYHSGCFKLLTKLKSRTMYRILELGYNTIWSDSDIVWFKNPVPYLLDLKKKYDATSEGLLITQSNEPNYTLPLNGIRRINSGFYLATPTKKSLERFDAVIARASKSKMSEQPNFYDELCGVKGEHRVGDNECFDKGMRVVYLDTRLFPNGGCGGLPPNLGIGGIWNSSDHRKDFPELYILHNNWIVGLSNKLERQTSRDLFFYDIDNGICKWDWMKEVPSQVL